MDDAKLPDFTDLFKPGPEAAGRRAEANAALLKALGEILAENPELRFNQALETYGFTLDHLDDFYTEPAIVLARVQKARGGK